MFRQRNNGSHIIQILLQTRCENRYNNSHFGEGKNQIGNNFSHFPLKKK